MGLLLVAAQRQSWGEASKPQYPYPRSLNLVGTEPLFAITLDGMDDQADAPRRRSGQQEMHEPANRHLVGSDAS